MLKPVKEIGKYGGTWRRGFTGPGDVENGNRINASDKLLFWDYTGTKIVPSVAKGVDMSADGKTYTISLRKGMKWSDGAPVHRRRLRVLVRGSVLATRTSCRRRSPDMTVNGKPGKVVKVDETTVEFEFDDPYFLFFDLLAGDTLIGGGQSVRQSAGLHVRRLCAQALPEAVPAEVFLAEAAATRWPSRKATRTGSS